MVAGERIVQGVNNSIKHFFCCYGILCNSIMPTDDEVNNIILWQ